MNARALTTMIGSAATAPRLVVLNACYSAPQAEALRDVVDCVVGTAGAIHDDAARSFAVSFYRALGNGRSVGNAFDQAVATLEAKGLRDEELPRCLTREDVDRYQVFLDSSEPAPARWASGSSRPGSPTRGRPATNRASRRPSASDPGATRYAEGAGGLHGHEILAMLRGSRGGDPPTPIDDPQAAGALAPYLAGTELSAEAYKEWLTRVCEQPDDD